MSGTTGCWWVFSDGGKAQTGVFGVRICAVEQDYNSLGLAFTVSLSAAAGKLSTQTASR